MDIKAYIESGIIERFVLGETNDQETNEVLAYAKRYPEIQSEIEAIENSLIQLAESSRYQASEKTEKELMSKLFGETVNKPADDFKITPVSTHKTNNNSAYLKAASLALLISVGANIYYYSKYKNSSDELMALQSENVLMAENNKVLDAGYKTLEKQYEAISSFDVIPVHLNGTALNPSAKAIVFYNPVKQEIVLQTDKLPKTDSEKQYQLWAIVDGKPVDAGVFDAGNIAKLELKGILNPSAFAVTIEKRGGSVNPTLEMMILLGNLSS